MKKLLIAIHDEAVEAFRPTIFLATTVAEAERMARNTMVSSTDDELSRSPQDFVLYTLGEVDFESGDIKPFVNSIGRMSQYKPRPALKDDQLDLIPRENGDSL